MNLRVKLLLILLLSGFLSCKKENKDTSPVIEGVISLEVQAKHHTLEVPGVIIYLMRNATAFPGNDSSIYTYHGKADSYGRYTFEKLFPGNYYAHVSGYDSLWQRYVTGNSPIILDESTLNNNQAQLTVNVSE